MTTAIPFARESDKTSLHCYQHDIQNSLTTEHQFTAKHYESTRRIPSKTNQFHLRRELLQPQWELYHLTDDISEQTNLAATSPHKVTELQTIWQRLDREMKEPRF
jgi:hypothetical protein